LGVQTKALFLLENPTFCLGHLAVLLYVYSAAELEKTATPEKFEEKLLGLFELHNGQPFLWLLFFYGELGSYGDIVSTRLWDTSATEFPFSQGSLNSGSQ
jgi:hypothetical protein